MAQKEFWITNLSNRLVNLHDLHLFIKPFTSMNLLDRRHLAITEKQIYNSCKTGSIFKKRDKIFVREVAPILEQDYQLDIDLTPVLPYKELSSIVVKEEVYEELLLTDEEVADQNSSMEADDDIETSSRKEK